LKAYLARCGSSHAPVGLATGRYTHDGEVLSKVLYRDTLAIQIGELGLVADILTSLKCNCCNILASGRPQPENGTECHRWRRSRRTRHSMGYVQLQEQQDTYNLKFSL